MFGARAGGAPLVAVEPGSGDLAGVPPFAGTDGTGALGTLLMSMGPFALAGEAFGGEMGRFGGDITFGAGTLGSAWQAGVFATEGAAACAGGVTVDAASVISTSCDWPELSAPVAFAGGAVE